MAGADLRDGLACSFCMKLPAQVSKLVAGPGVFICNECVDLCNEIIATVPDSSPGSDASEKVEAWHRRLSDEDLLGHLPKVAAASAQVEQQLTASVRQARERGITWARIGEALGMTRQSAWERFSGEDN
jgi:hypothetical protein